VEDKNKTTHEVAEVSAGTLDKLSSPDADIRQSGLIDIFEQHLPQIPADYAFKRKDRKFVEDALNVAFDLTGGIPPGVRIVVASSDDINRIGDGQERSCEAVFNRTERSAPAADDAAAEQAGVGAGPRERYYGANALYLAPSTSQSRNSGARKWEKC
jgi:hypothetical protein